jgi:hypothetical protein
VAKKAGEIVINIRAGTTNLQSDLGKATEKFKQFGQHSVSGVQATSGALRLLEGNLTNNLRASERFLANTLKLGPVLQAAFPIVGGLAFAGLLAELGSKVANFFSKLKEGPEKLRGGFANLNASLKVTNDGLAVSNARLLNEIAQLQGKPTNNLRVALLEAKEAADKLNESVERTLTSTYKLITEQSGSWMSRIGSRLVGTSGIQDIAEHIGGKTGVGGFEAQIRNQSGAELQASLAAEAQWAQKQLEEAQAKQGAYKASPGLFGKEVVGDQGTRIEVLQGHLADIKQLQEQIQQTGTNSALNTKKAGLEDKAEAFGLGKAFTDKLHELNAQLEATKTKLDAVGLSESGKILAAGYEATVKVIAEVNKGLEKRHTQLTDNQIGEIHSVEIAIAQAEAEAKWKESFTQATDALKDRIAAQEKLNDAIGGSYSQQRSAYIESHIAAHVGAQNYNDPEFMRNHAAQVAALRGQLGQEYDQDAAGKNTKALQQLQDKIRLTNAMAAAEREGAEAVRQAELAERIRVATRGMDAAAADKLAAAMREEYAAERREESEKELATLRQQATAMDALANAYGHKARVQAEAQNAYNSAIHAGKSPDVAQAAAAEVLKKDQDEILTQANQLATTYSDQLQHLNQMKAALEGIAALRGHTLEIDEQINAINVQILETQAAALEKSDSVLGGLQAGLDRMAAQAEHVGQIVADAMQQMVDAVSKNIADMLTGEKPKHTTWGQEWGKTFKNVGHGLIQNTVKSGLDRLAGVHKPTGTAGDPIHVIVDNGHGGAGPNGSAAPANAVTSPLATLAGKLGLGGLFGGGSQGGGIFSALGGLFGGGGDTPSVTSAISFPGMADGGDVYSGGLAMIGEDGPEVANFPKGARVTPLDKMGGSPTFHMHYEVHAEGAQIGVETRVAAAIEAAQQSAIKTAVQAVHQQKWRTPQRTGKQ